MKRFSLHSCSSYFLHSYNSVAGKKLWGFFFIIIKWSVSLNEDFAFAIQLLMSERRAISVHLCAAAAKTLMSPFAGANQLSRPAWC